MEISKKLSKQNLRDQIQNLAERVEWLEQQIEQHQMSSEIIWFINNRYKLKFFKGGEDE